MSTTYESGGPDAYAGARDTTEGTVYTVTGQDWDSVVQGVADDHSERVVVNMGPQHPSTHGVLRLILELEGETVTESRVGIGYLHTGIEKNLEFRTWTQGVTFVTRMDYLSPFFNETAYCLGVEKLLGITDEIPERATVIRVLMMELNRMSSHLVALATGGMELGALTAMIFGFRERETILDLFELVTGLRMNHAYVRPGGVVPGPADGRGRQHRRDRDAAAQELQGHVRPAGRQRHLEGAHRRRRLPGPCRLHGARGHRSRAARHRTAARPAQVAAVLRLRDLRLRGPGAPTPADAYGRFLVRLDELQESLKIVEQCLDRLKPGPIMVADKKIAWPAQLALGSDGLGNSLDHIRHIMGESMEALIHHFKLVTEGFRVPAGQVYQAVESPRGELGVHIVSDGGTRPYRVHFRDPSFTNLQATAAMCEGGMIADVIAAVASIDPVMGGVDR